MTSATIIQSENGVAYMQRTAPIDRATPDREVPKSGRRRRDAKRVTQEESASTAKS